MSLRTSCWLFAAEGAVEELAVVVLAACIVRHALTLVTLPSRHTCSRSQPPCVAYTTGPGTAQKPYDRQELMLAERDQPPSALPVAPRFEITASIRP